MLEPCVVPDALFDALAAGEGGPEAVRLLLRARRSRHLLLLRRVLDGPCGAAAEPAAALLARIERAAPAVVGAVTGGPAFGTWAARAVRDCPAHRRGGCAARELAALAVVAAVRAERAAEIAVPVRAGRLPLPGLGTVCGLGDAAEAVVGVEPGAGPAGACRVRIAAGGTAHPLPRDLTRAGHGWEPVAVLAVEHRGLALRVPLETADPRLPALDTASAGPAAWLGLLGPAWELLVERHPGRAAELAAGLTALVPLPAPARGVASATSRHAFGTVLTSWPADPERLALSLLHEFQHSKLSALTDLVALHEGDGGARLYAPWRPDPRPAAGLLQGVYAHLGDLAFWRERGGREDGPGQADAAWRAAGTRVHVERGLAEATAHVPLTGLGVRFLDRVADTVRAGADVPDARLLRAVARVQTGEEAVWRLRWGVPPDAAATARLVARRRAGRPPGELPPDAVRPATGPVTGPGPDVMRWAARQRGAERARPARDAARAAAAEPHRADRWAELAAAAAEERLPGATALRHRTDLVRHLFLSDPADPLDLAAWLAAGDPDGSEHRRLDVAERAVAAGEDLGDRVVVTQRAGEAGDDVLP
ncbi:aKG-HExxH-type peptide beta-hydroxylase [Streptomyces sp. NPDC048182]|uniref:aKG-HExxH-type peptide beta-hydroxylase n=1 Tax=Streptomyces sp. NPDC048182 TaxID=3365507 RepID=UPI00371E0A73